MKTFNARMSSPNFEVRSVLLLVTQASLKPTFLSVGMMLLARFATFQSVLAAVFDAIHQLIGLGNQDIGRFW